ncbi:UPF0160 protein [Astathelohania contejeani]|uniref:UPF0160 protein n=1 Tax=Astathelohania contejeani TaxID=164912 RepID=A0ABQ7HZM1_9MICR|nr:UPF0160 protein [Thelohania contejeani]
MKLITHDEKFHLDEVLSSVILKRIYPDAKITRSRNNEIINSGDIVYDVGGIFDPTKKRFDHHQPTFHETYSPKYNIKLSSSGLIYKYFTDEFFKTYGVESTHEHYKELVEEVYETYFLSADAHDNGYQITGDIVPRTLAAMVGNFNSNQKFSKEQDEAFYRAMEFVEKDLNMYMSEKINNWLPSINHLDAIVKKSEGPILIDDSSFHFDSIDLILKVEKKYGKDIKYVITEHRNNYKIYAVPKRARYFENKVPLKKEWGGLRDEELEKVSGIKGAKFVHASGFIGICTNLKGALEMCKKSMESNLN